MSKHLALIVAILLFAPGVGAARDGGTTLEGLAKALGAATLNSLQYRGSGVIFAVGQSPAPGAPWPRFDLRSFTRAVNYETASLRDDVVRAQGEDPPRGGGNQPIRGELRQVFVLSGGQA